MRAAHLGVVAAAGQQSGGSPPAAGAHRYWRMLVTAIEGGYSTVCLSELEFWDRRYARRAAGTYSESGTSAVEHPGWAYDGLRQTGALASGYWRSNAGAIWIKLDAGSPIPMAAIVIWKAGITAGVSGSHIAAFDVQYSDDNATWTTAWSVGDASISGTTAPGVFNNPGYVGDPILDSAITPLHWLRLDGSVYSDAGSTPAVDNDGIAQAENYGSNGVPFTQPTGGIRPTFKTGGLNGKPFLRCSFAAAQRFEDIAITQPSGTSTLTPCTVVAVTDNVDVTNFPSLLGSIANNGGKIGCYFRPNAGEQVHVGHSANRFGNVANPQVLVASRIAQANAVALLNGARFANSTSSFNEVSTEITSANLLWNDGLTTPVADGFFDGDLYELMYIEASLSDLERFRISEYARGKYGGIY